MFKFDKINATQLMLWGIGGLIVYYAIKRVGAGVNDAVNAAGEMAAEALPYSNPITAPIALANELSNAIIGAIKPNTTTGAVVTDNFNWYLQLHGGASAYLEQKRTGTFDGEPYDANKDYKKLYNSQSSYGLTGILTFKPLRDLL